MSHIRLFCIAVVFLIGNITCYHGTSTSTMDNDCPWRLGGSYRSSGPFLALRFRLLLATSLGMFSSSVISFLPPPSPGGSCGAMQYIGEGNISMRNLGMVSTALRVVHASFMFCVSIIPL